MSNEQEFDVIDPVSHDKVPYNIGDTIKLSDQKVIDRLKALKCIADKKSKTEPAKEPKK